MWQFLTAIFAAFLAWLKGLRDGRSQLEKEECNAKAKVVAEEIKQLKMSKAIDNDIASATDNDVAEQLRKYDRARTQ